jgi:hypothetical protein
VKDRRLCDPNAEAFPSSGNGGLTKREWFAGMALQGLLASGRHYANFAALAADATIRQLNANEAEGAEIE